MSVHLFKGLEHNVVDWDQTLQLFESLRDYLKFIEDYFYLKRVCSKNIR